MECHPSDDLQVLAEQWGSDHSALQLSYPPEIRKAIYTTNAIESLNMSLRKVTKNRGSFPNDETMTQLLYLAMKNISIKMNHADPGMEVSAESVYYAL